MYFTNCVNVIDLEATCWSKEEKPGITEIIQIGIVKLDLRNEPKELYFDSYYIKPEHSSSLSDYCCNLTGITNQALERAWNFRGVAARLRGDYNSDKIPWISWGNLDYQLFNNNSKLFKTPNPMSQYFVDFQPIFSNLMKLKTAPSLKDACDLFEIEFTGKQHNAFDDASNLAKIYLKFLKIFQRNFSAESSSV